ncbi:ead/Ea22-like family protein [Salmonella enterica]|nr:ead/Ea22-like family protein [Salmonella enterica]
MVIDDNDEYQVIVSESLEDGGGYCSYQSVADEVVNRKTADFIAAFNPATVLALLDELEHYKSREDRVTKLVQDNSTSWDELYKKLEAAEKLIAELQIARDKCFLSGLKTGWEYGIADDTEEYNREIADAQAVIDRAAGIGVKGE